MKIIFVYTDYNPLGYNYNKFNMGIATLSSCLKEAGHQTSLIHISEKIEKEQFLEQIQKHKPDVAAFSSITNMWPQIKVFTAWAKELNILNIHGGTHPTVNPEEVINTYGVDFLCRGEGEKALVEFCNCLEANKDVQRIKNLWVKKKNGEVIRNTIRPLIENLDELPYLDYEIFNYEELQDAKTMKRLVAMASRGCPYQCTYCCNHFIKTLYPNKQKYVRHKSVDRLIGEIKYGLQKYPFLETVTFFDDTLSLNKEWFAEFVDKYRREINLPYTCNDRLNQINPDIAKGLKKSGCKKVALGIESGNERIRNELMKRFMTNRQIIDGYKALRDVNIKTTAFNIVGVPSETIHTMLETVKLNAEANPDRFTNAYFYPFKGTALFDICKDKGYLIDRNISSFFERPILSLDTVSEHQTMFVYKYFYFLVKLYKCYMSLPKVLSTKLINITDRFLTSKYFPYRFFNGISDSVIYLKLFIANCLKKYPPAYNLSCSIWRKIITKL